VWFGKEIDRQNSAYYCLSYLNKVTDWNTNMSGISELLALDSGGHCHSNGLGCGISRLAGSSGSSLASALLLLSSSSSNFQPVDSIISFVSLQSSYAWYMHLSEFETVFLSLAMLQVNGLNIFIKILNNLVFE